MQVRHNLTQTDLACRFSLEQSSVSRILNSWIPMLSAQLKGLIKWPQTTVGPVDPQYNFFLMLLASSTAQKFLFNIHWASNLTTQNPPTVTIKVTLL